MKQTKLLGRKFDTLSKLEFFEQVDALYQVPNTKASKAVRDVTLSILSNRTIVKINRTPKNLNLSEVEALAAEHKVEVLWLTELLTKRKIDILNEQGEVTNVRTKKPRKTSGRKKANDDDSRRGSADGS